MTTQITGEVIPSDVPGLLAMAVRQPVGVVLAIAPWNAPVILGVRAHRDAARLRQHRRAEGLRAVPGHPSPDRRGAEGGRASRPAWSTSSPTPRTTPPTSSRR